MQCERAKRTTFCLRWKRSHSTTDPSTLDESSRPAALPPPLCPHTSDVTLDSEFPCIVCTQTNPQSGHRKSFRLLHGSRTAMGWGWGWEVWGSVRAGGASRRSPGRRARARASRPSARRRPGRRRERWRARRQGRATTRPRRRCSGGRGAYPWAGGPMRWRRRRSGRSGRF